MKVGKRYMAFRKYYSSSIEIEIFSHDLKEGHNIELCSSIVGIS